MARLKYYKTFYGDIIFLRRSGAPYLRRLLGQCITTRFLIPFLSIAIAHSTPGCGNDNGEIGDYEYRTDMHEQVSFKRHEDPRPSVAGTVPVRGYEAPIADSISASRIINPVKLTAANADTAKFLYEAYCTPCHGFGAKGDGLVVKKFQQPPDLTAEKYKRVSDGYIYWVIRKGHLIMPAYFEHVKSRERWLIVNHIRSLQKE